MVRRAERFQPRRYEDTLDLPPFTTVNLFDPHSQLPRNQLRAATDYDLYSGGYMRGRRGSTNLGAPGQKLGDRDVIEGGTWKIGSVEYAIVQQKDSGGTGTEFYFCQINPTPSAWTQILTLAAANLAIADLVAADMFISGDRLYVFHGLGNYIIQWDGAAFVARPQGLQGPRLTSIAAGGAGNLTGLYTWGVELLYQVDGADVVASSPWRKTSGGRLLEATLAGTSANIQVDSASLPAAPGDYWNYARLWRSFRRDVDISNPLLPRDAAGVPDELYPVKLVSKTDLAAALYIINDDVPDSDLPGDLTSEYPAVDIKRIELSPLPAASCGTYLNDRIWCAPAALSGKIVFTPSAGDAYGEQYNPLSVVKAEPGDTQAVVKLVPFEEDLIVLKEAKTAWVQRGDPDLGCKTLDHNIGITHRKLARYVPKVGICAITNDQGEFKIFGYDRRWQNVVNDIDLSRAIRNETAAMDGEENSFLYINGKLMIFDGTPSPFVLHSKERLGWTRYNYALATAQLVLSFAGGTRACVISKNAYVVEIEKDGLDTDVDTGSDAATIIEPTFEPWRYQNRSERGQDNLEFRWYSVQAKLSNDLRGIPYVNGKEWPTPATEQETRFTPPTSAYAADDAGLEREYRLYLPENRPVGSYLGFKFKTVAPCTIHAQSLRCFIDEAGMGAGHFDPFEQLTDAEATPDWIDNLELDAGDGARDTSTMEEMDAGEGVRDTSTMEEIDRDA